MDASKAGEAANYYEGSMDACDRRFANNKRMLDRECVLVCFVCGNCAGRRAAAHASAPNAHASQPLAGRWQGDDDRREQAGHDYGWLARERWAPPCARAACHWQLPCSFARPLARRSRDSVGPQARGKSFTARKLKRYLTWLGLRTRIYNVGKARRAMCTPPSPTPLALSRRASLQRRGGRVARLIGHALVARGRTICSPAPPPHS